jgi:hypothetical protein
VRLAKIRALSLTGEARPVRHSWGVSRRKRAAVRLRRYSTFHIPGPARLLAGSQAGLLTKNLDVRILMNDREISDVLQSLQRFLCKSSSEQTRMKVIQHRFVLMKTVYYYNITSDWIAYKIRRVQSAFILMNALGGAAWGTK